MYFFAGQAAVHRTTTTTTNWHCTDLLYGHCGVSLCQPLPAASQVPASCHTRQPANPPPQVSFPRCTTRTTVLVHFVVPTYFCHYRPWPAATYQPKPSFFFPSCPPNPHPNSAIHSPSNPPLPFISLSLPSPLPSSSLRFAIPAVQFLELGFARSQFATRLVPARLVFSPCCLFAVLSGCPVRIDPSRLPVGPPSPVPRAVLCWCSHPPPQSRNTTSDRHTHVHGQS